MFHLITYTLGILFLYMHRSSFIILYYDQQIHNYFTKLHNCVT